MFNEINNDSRPNPFWQKAAKILNIDTNNSPFGISIKIAMIYIVLGLLWIFTSDKIVAIKAADKKTMELLSVFKGSLYVLFSGGVIFLLVLVAFKKLKTKEEEISNNYTQLKTVCDELAISERLNASIIDKLHQSAYTDALTELPNRLSLYEKLANSLASMPQERKALLSIDSDNFKFINDTLGHSFGDKLISEIGKRLSMLSGTQAEVHRLGGDEYAIFFSGFNMIEEVEECAVKIVQGFNTPFEIGSSMLHSTVSIGISMYPEDGDTVDELVRNADIALYRAKSSGKNKFVFFSHNMQKSMVERMLVEKHLRSALENNEFLLYYQPQYDIKAERITGFEALIRWKSPELGLVSPLKFISIAEETHLIIPIGEWVLRNACIFLKQLHIKGYTDLIMSVNVSILQLLQENFVDSVRRVLEFIDMDPKFLELEITESILMESYQSIINILNKLKELGIKIALDDFGQGYSSLSYLKQLPINTLKIDKSFVDNIGSKKASDNLTGIIVLIGRRMGLSIVAEGVENKDQLAYLSRNKCHRIQGYLISKPLPECEVDNLLAKYNEAVRCSPPL